MGIVISTVNMKGGVGKTTLTVNLATCLAKNHHKKVLVLDLDAQISATLSLMPPIEFAKIRRKSRTLNYLLDKYIQLNNRKQLDISALILDDVCEIRNLHLLPGDLELHDEYLVSKMLHDEVISEGKAGNFDLVWNNFERRLIKNILEPVRDEYDFILIDCAPGYNLLTRSGIAASDFYLLPARPEPLSIVGIQLLERRINKLKENHQNITPINLKLLGIVFILSDNNIFGKYYKQVMKRVVEDFSPDKLFEIQIPMDVNVAKAVDSFTPVVLSHPNSSGAKKFVQLTQELLQKLSLF